MFLSHFTCFLQGSLPGFCLPCSSGVCLITNLRVLLMGSSEEPFRGPMSYKGLLLSRLFVSLKAMEYLISVSANLEVFSIMV